MSEKFSGKIINGKYRLVSLLGQGGMGEIYLAEQLDTEGRPLRQIALKMVSPQVSDDPDVSKRALQEMRIAASLRNAHWVQLFDVGRAEDGRHYFVMEIVRGVTLKEVLDRERSLTVSRTVAIASQICEALSEAHDSAHIVHRDLKPSNIFIEQREGHDFVKVGDFGIAKPLEENATSLTHTGQFVGTPRYMSPEQLSGNTVDGRADLYARGCLLYEMLVGHPPFTGELVTLVSQHLNREPPQLPTALPPGIRQLVHQLLAKKPEDRPPDALSVKRALEGALVGFEDQYIRIVTETHSPPPQGVNSLSQNRPAPPPLDPTFIRLIFTFECPPS